MSLMLSLQYCMRLAADCDTLVSSGPGKI